MAVVIGVGALEYGASGPDVPRVFRFSGSPNRGALLTGPRFVSHPASVGGNVFSSEGDVE